MENKQFNISAENMQAVVLHCLVSLIAQHRALSELTITALANEDEAKRQYYESELNRRRDEISNDVSDYIWEEYGCLNVSNIMGTNPQPSTTNQEQPAKDQHVTPGTADSRGNFWGFLKRSR